MNTPAAPGQGNTARIVISGASGALGRRVAEVLAQRLAPQQLVLASRHPEALADWAQRGATVVQLNPKDPASLRRAYEGCDRLLLISGLNIGERVAEHAAALDAARAVGIGHVTYTSVGGVHPRNPTPSCVEHLATERLLWASGLPFAALRNQLYAEMVYEMLWDQPLRTGRWEQPCDEGHLSPVSREDIADCAAAIMLAPQDHDRVVYEITGPQRLRLRDMAALGTELFGPPIEYVPITADAMFAAMDAMGVPRRGIPDASFPPVRFGSDELVHNLVAIEMGYQDILTHHVQYITGHPPRRLRDVLLAEHQRRAPAQQDAPR
jgi:NAD(P)H dehydrogenase (quinone)